MIRSLVLVLLGLFVIPSVTWCQEAVSPPSRLLTLEQAIATALQNNRLVKNAALEVEKSEDQVAATRTYRLPAFKLYTLGSELLTQIDFLFERGVFGTFPGTGPIPAEDTTISTPQQPTALVIGQVTQPLSQLYRIGLGIQLQEVIRDISREKLRSQQQSIVNDVKRVYYGILQTQSALEAIEEAIKLYRELDRVVGEYVIQQKALKSESLDVKTQLAKAEYQAVTLRNLLASQKEQLNGLLGRDIWIEFSVNQVPDFPLFGADLESARAHALRQRSEVKEAQLKIKQAEFDRRIKKSEYIPDISLSLNYVSPINYSGLVPENIATVGVQLSWDLFDWGRKGRELAEKSKTIEQANNGLHEAETQVSIDVNSRFRKLQETQALLHVNQLARETAQEKLRVTMNRY
ncbi:MAG: TolC family protein, partial [Nitrososphaera sp.]|nr:TolC family protein [Nitrososphaera sp.]